MPDFVSIIIPALNEEKFIGKCLNSIFELNTPLDKYEVILVDNGSLDNTINIARQYNISVFIKPNATIAALRNFGVKHAKGNILAFLDADCKVSPDWLNIALSVLKDPHIGIVGCPFNIPENCSWISKSKILVSTKTEKKGEIDWLPSSNMIFSRNCYDSIEGFNDELMSNEDVDVCFRASKAGYKIYSDPRAAIWHLGECDSLTEYFKKEVWRGHDVFWNFLKYRNLCNLKAVLYASIFFIIMITVICCSLSIVFFSVGKSIFYISFTTFVSIPFLLAFYFVCRSKQWNYLFKVMILLMVYGSARAVSIFRIGRFTKDRTN